MTEPTVLLKVSQRWDFSPTHQTSYAGGSTEYMSDGSIRHYLSRGHSLSVRDHLSVTVSRYAEPGMTNGWETVHVNCCTEHDHR